MNKLLYILFPIILFSCKAEDEFNNTGLFSENILLDLRSSNTFASKISDTQTAEITLTYLNNRVSATRTVRSYQQGDVTAFYNESDLDIFDDELYIPGNGYYFVSFDDGAISPMSPGAKVDDFRCECRDENGWQLNDCLKKNLSNCTYCDGNLCIACSLYMMLYTKEITTGGIIVKP